MQYQRLISIEINRNKPYLPSRYIEDILEFIRIHCVHVLKGSIVISSHTSNTYKPSAYGLLLLHVKGLYLKDGIALIRSQI